MRKSEEARTCDFRMRAKYMTDATAAEQKPHELKIALSG